MLGELVKILADEPEKIVKALIKGIRIVFSIIIASFLYKLIIGDYKLIPLTNYELLAQFVISGRVLICLLLFFISEYFVIEILELIAFAPIWFLRRKKLMQITDVEITPLLRFFGVIKIKNDHSLPIPGNNIDLLKNFVEQMDDDTTKEEAADLKNSIIENVWQLYFIFTVIYFVIIDKVSLPHQLTTIILTILLFVFMLAVGIQAFFDYLSDHHIEIFRSLSFIKTNAVIEGCFADFNIHLQQASRRSGMSKTQVFFRNGKEYVLTKKMYGEKLYADQIQTFVSRRAKPNRVFIVVVHTDFIDETADLRLEQFNNLIMIEYTDDDNLKAQLTNTLLNI